MGSSSDRLGISVKESFSHPQSNSLAKPGARCKACDQQYSLREADFRPNSVRAFGRDGKSVESLSLGSETPTGRRGKAPRVIKVLVRRHFALERSQCF